MDESLDAYHLTIMHARRFSFFMTTTKDFVRCDMTLSYAVSNRRQPWNLFSYSSLSSAPLQVCM